MGAHHEYMRQAEHCQFMASQMENSEIRGGWLKLARAWLQMIPESGSDSEPPKKKARGMIWPG
jgi:hypothetical protein